MDSRRFAWSIVRFLVVVQVLWAAARPQTADATDELRILMLGDQGHHQPAARYAQLQPVLAAQNIRLEYTQDIASLTLERLQQFDGLLLYANIEEMPASFERDLLQYVTEGGGFIPIHCASYCFLNSAAYVDLVGAQFQRHGTGTFRAEIAASDHPIMQGFHGFESFDETYVHTRHNERNRVVLQYRVEGDHREPWTWVRTHGAGRVFYTAWGHDERTWSQLGFHNLIERGIRWAVGEDPRVVAPYRDDVPMTALRTDVTPLEYIPANLPFYPAGERWGTIGEPIRKMPKPLPAEESIKHFVTPVGFEVHLFAAEPDIGKPICMNWDERGRLWLCETIDYPNEKQPPGKGRDRIRICEDADGDGRADKFTVFAEDLSIPTSLTFSRGGVIVHQAPQTLWLKDVDGDDVADERKVLLDGWSISDTHAGPSNLQYGMDNWIWGMVGYAGFEGTVDDQRVALRTGFYRFRPDGSQLELLRNTNNNSWGVGISEEGILFGSTANGNPSEYMPIPNRYYETVRGWSSTVLGGIAENNRYYPITENVRQVDFHGGFTAAAGHAIYTARSYPREYWNRTAFVTEPTGHLAATFVIQPQGANFRARNSWNLIASDDQWSAPIMAEVGPDGQVWILDWYNIIVQHNPTPAGFKTGKGNAYETDLRDKRHGRVYRIVYTGADGSEPDNTGEPDNTARPFSLHRATHQQLVAALSHPNMFWRKHAQRLLVERGELDVVPALVDLLARQQLDEIGLDVGAIHALWTLEGLGAIDPQQSHVVRAVEQALEHPSAGVRRSACLTLPRTAESLNALLQSKVLQDLNGQVRLAALLALAEMPAAEPAADELMAALLRPENLRDRWLPDALTAAAARHDHQLLAKAAALPAAAFDHHSDQLLSVIQRVLAVVSEHYARGGPVDTVNGLAALLPDAPAPVAEAIVSGWARGWPKDHPPRLQPEVDARLVQLLETLPAASRGQLVSLAGRWQSPALSKHVEMITASLLQQALDDQADEPARLAAAEQVIALKPDDAGAVAELLTAITPRTSPELAKGLLSAVRQSEADEAGSALLAAYGAMTPAVRGVALTTLLSRAPWASSLLDAIADGTVRLGELSLDQKQALSNHPDQRVARRAARLLEQGGMLPDPDRQRVLAELMPLAELQGDPVKGKIVFTNQCAKCHMHSGEGNRVGPDLTGMAVHPKEELLTQILDPSRSVEGNYRMYTIVLSDGRIVSGLLASESRTSLELFDAEGKKQILLREDVEQLVASPKSLMPDGFEKQVPQEDLVNLLAFLTQRGKFLTLPLEKAATIVSTRGMFIDENSTVERLVFDDWSPKEFAGVPFQLVDPQDGRTPNAIMLYAPQGTFPPQMPKNVSLPCNAAAAAIHMLGGVSGWGFPLGERGSVTLIVRLHYADGTTEDHPLTNGEHFADYIRVFDVPQSKLAFQLHGRQLRYLAIHPQRADTIERIELIKGPDATAPVVMAVTIETVQATN